MQSSSSSTFRRQAIPSKCRLISTELSSVTSHLIILFIDTSVTATNPIRRFIFPGIEAVQTNRFHRLYSETARKIYHTIYSVTYMTTVITIAAFLDIVHSNARFWWGWFAFHSLGTSYYLGKAVDRQVTDCRIKRMTIAPPTRTDFTAIYECNILKTPLPTGWA